MGKTLIISVGGSTAPIICSIKHHQPENIIFFCSEQTEPQVTEIRNEIIRKNLTPLRLDEKIVSESAEDINSCLKAILTKLPEILERWKIGLGELIVDYTGGTKSMSSALVLGTLNYTKCFSYVGAKDEKSRNKDGIGVVIDGQEKVIILKNPWEELAVEERKKICLLFNSGRYQAALEVCRAAKEKVPDQQKPFFSTLGNFIKVYWKWDSFFYEEAYHVFSKTIHEGEILCQSLPNNHSLINFLEKSKKNLRFLTLLVQGKEAESEKAKGILSPEEKRIIEWKKDECRLLDLLANAKRRAYLENRYDDALVRIYRALEKRAQLELKKYGLDASNINLDLIPEAIREEIKSKYYNLRKNKVEVPLYAAYQILIALEEEKKSPGIGHRFFEKYESQVAPIIDFRNNNIIVHGDITADEEKFADAWTNCLSFLEINEENLPEFPRLEL